MHTLPLVCLGTVPLRFAKTASQFEPCLQQCVAARLTDFSLAHAYLRLHVVYTDSRIRQFEGGGQCRTRALTTVSF